MENTEFKVDETNVVEQKAFTMDADQQKAFDLIANTNTPLFITGKAGTGKSTFIKMIQEEIDKNFLVLAPTGSDRTPYSDEGIGGKADTVEAYRHDYCGRGVDGAM